MVKFRWPLSSRTETPRPRSGVELDLTELAQYVRSADDRQNAVDLIPGWNCALPPEAGANTGSGALYDDARIHWAMEQFGDIRGRRVLELGPMEASHTYMLEKAGAVVHAVEANKLAFLKCLIAKELLDLRAKFSLAEANEWLRNSTVDYDLVVACGVLYHMRDPMTFLELVARRTTAIFLWTHFVDEDELKSAMIGDKPYFSVEQRNGLAIRLFSRSYINAQADPAFCGGVFDMPRWMLKEDILSALAAFGFDDVVIRPDNGAGHSNGPAMSIFARKTRG